MGARNNVLKVVSGWEAVELVLRCIFLGIWQLVQISVKSLWKGHRRKYTRNGSQIQLTVDSSVGTHCYIKIMGVKYHYVETGPRNGQLVLILGDAPDTNNLWGPNWSRVVQQLSQAGFHVITLDLRGTGGSEGGGRSDLSPPRAVEELATLLEAMGVSKNKPAVVMGFGIGGMMAWYLVHCHGSMISKFAAIGAPHPNLYWKYPPASFCHRVLHFIQWPYFPERWLAEGEPQECDNRWTSSRACDWSGALNYVRGAAWWRVRPDNLIETSALLVGDVDAAAQLVSSAKYCITSTLRLVTKPDPSDKELAAIVLDFLIAKEKIIEVETKTLVGRTVGRIAAAAGAVAGRGRELTAKLVAQPAQG